MWKCPTCVTGMKRNIKKPDLPFHIFASGQRAAEIAESVWWYLFGAINNVYELIRMENDSPFF